MTDKTSPMPDEPLFTVIAPVLNEQECLTAFYDEVTSAFTAIDNPFEIVFVNDGSIILNHRDTVNVCKGLNSLTVTNTNRNKRLTRLSVSSGMLQADGFFISNMKHATADTVVCY